MNNFKDLWQLLETHGVIDSKRADCEAQWNEYSPDEQQATYNNLAYKIKTGKFVHYNPLRAIHDNKPRQVLKPAEEPVNYNGRALPEEPVVTAFYNGKWGTYTLADAERFNLKIKDR